MFHLGAPVLNLLFVSAETRQSSPYSLVPNQPPAFFAPMETDQHKTRTTQPGELKEKDWTVNVADANAL